MTPLTHTIEGQSYTLRWICGFHGRSHFSIHSGRELIVDSVIYGWDGNVTNGWTPYPKHSIARRLVARLHWRQRRALRAARWPQRHYRRLGA